MKNTVEWPENGLKSLKSIFELTSSTFNPEFFRAESIPNMLTKNTKVNVVEVRYFFYRVLKVGSDPSISSFGSQYILKARKSFFLLNNIKIRINKTKCK